MAIISMSTNSQLSHVPAHFFRKATLKNSEPLGTEELARIERRYTRARESLLILNIRFLCSSGKKLASISNVLQQLAQAIATVDVLQKFALVCRWVATVESSPFKQNDSRDKGRHPVVEKVMEPVLYSLITSLWMKMEYSADYRAKYEARKSTYMRQLAIIVILLELALVFQPVAIFDAIYTWSGCWWPGIGAVYCFMVEMMEANHAHSQDNHPSPWFCLMSWDEERRRMALAQSIIEYIHDHAGAKTLFATHYHEVDEALLRNLVSLENVRICDLGRDGQVTFFTELNPAQQINPMGFTWPKIAGLPEELLKQADAFDQKARRTKAASTAWMQL